MEGWSWVLPLDQFSSLKTGKFCRIILSNVAFSFVKVETGMEEGSVASLGSVLGRGKKEPEPRILDPAPTHVYSALWWRGEGGVS